MTIDYARQMPNTTFYFTRYFDDRRNLIGGHSALALRRPLKFYTDGELSTPPKLRHKLRPTILNYAVQATTCYTHARGTLTAENRPPKRDYTISS